MFSLVIGLILFGAGAIALIGRAIGYAVIINSGQTPYPKNGYYWWPLDWLIIWYCPERPIYGFGFARVPHDKNRIYALNAGWLKFKVNLGK